ncbi:MAG: hypothetical protein IPK97_17275 [Ahniella sp.]|nr:hypothetical protein [Ahniella sp.]
MKRNPYIYASGLTFVLFAATACSSSTDDASAPKATEEPPVVSAVSEAESGWQSCDELGRVDVVAGPSVTTTCQIKLTGLDEGFIFKVDLIPGEVKEDGMTGDDAMVRVTKMMGEDEHQIIEETLVTLLVPPEYRDINGDSEADVLITTDLGKCPMQATACGSAARTARRTIAPATSAATSVRPPRMVTSRRRKSRQRKLAMYRLL